MAGSYSNRKTPTYFSLKSQPEDVFQMNANAGPQTLNQARPSTMDLPEPGFSMHQHPMSYGQLPPIPPPEKHNPPAGHGCPWPNGVSNESVAFDWEEAGLKSRPIIFFGLSPLDDRSRSLQLDSIISIAWIQPKSIGANQWDLGLPTECSPLCHSVKQVCKFK